MSRLEDELGVYGAHEIREMQEIESYTRQMARHRGPEKARHPDEPHPLAGKSVINAD